MRRHELLADVADRAACILKGCGMGEQEAQDAGDAIADDLADNWGGQFITVPKDMKYRHAKRAQQIHDEFNGTNHAELATKHGLSVNAIYKILKRVQRQ
ncbi:Mor transcription activator family protein [Pseudomonas sp. WS 5013]|nr:Mor transcription activator family protein [Pseudomonas sp. WS 5013]